ncbi:transcriptional regulator [Cupriavidus sp. TMH.W2]|uniref:transcriptional regulator n=1 Tax=Cupriavidus sp. TMH.W2 TaxID=3434465 RepID=UPI003D772C6D
MAKKVKDPSKLPQRELIRYAMERLDLPTRQQFADRFLLPKRTLDNWLIPDDESKEFRTMPAVVALFICYVLKHEDV